MMLKAAAVSIALFLLPTASTAQTADGDLTVTFLHINDHHSHFEPVSFDMLPEVIPDGLSVDTPDGVKVYYGGAAHVAGAIKELAESADERGRNVMKIHGGDAVTGTVYYSLFGGEPDAVFMNQVGFDAFVIGNHEFDDGDEVLSEFLGMLDLPVTSYNLKPGANSPLLDAENLVKYYVKTFDNGDKVGFCGMTPKTKVEKSSFPDPGTTIQDEAEATAACVADLEAEGVNKVVVVSHAGIKLDTERLALIDGVDVIIGGDSHTLLGVNASSLGGPSSSYSYATIVNDVCIVQAWEYQKVVGELTVSWDADGNVLNCTGEPHLPFLTDKFTVIDEEGEDFDMTEEGDLEIMNAFLSGQPNFLPAMEDTAVSDAIQPFYEETDAQMQTKIATSIENMCHNRGQGGDVPVKCSDTDVQTKLGGGVCQLVSHGFLYKVPDADFAIQNAGGCRTDIDKGAFSIADAYSILPFSNTLVTLVMTGAQIKSVLEDALENFLNETISGSDGSFPNAAGLRWVADYTESFGERIIDLEVNSRLESDEWQPIIEDENYVIVTNNFIAVGKDGYNTFAESGNYTDTFVNYAQSFMDFATAEETLETPPIDQFSSQKITFADGSVADGSEVVEETDSVTVPIEPIAGELGNSTSETLSDSADPPESGASIISYPLVAAVGVLFAVITA